MGLTHRLWAGLILVALFLGNASLANADHFRGGYIDWKLIGGNTVEFRAVQLFDAADVDTLPINPGVNDSTIIGPEAIVFTSVDIAGEPYSFVEYSVIYTYPGPTVFPVTAFFSLDDEPVNCCRLGSLVNVPADGFRVATVVDLDGGANAGSPTSSIPMIIQLEDDSRCANTVALAPLIADDGAFTCGLTTDGPAGAGTTAGVNPASLAITPGCSLSMDTSGTSVGDKFATQVIITETPTGASMAIDLIIEIKDGFCPVCGDDLTEGSEICDGTDDGACVGGSCQSNCTCCGDGVANAGEICDGADDAACGAETCTGSCTCTGGGGPGGGGGCSGPSCSEALPICSGATGPFTLEVGESFETEFPASAVFTGIDPCEDLIVNNVPWGSLPTGAVLESPPGTAIPEGTTQAAPSTGLCTHDGATVCSNNAGCQLCSHDGTTICTTDAQCDALSAGSVCDCGVSSCVIPDNTFPVTFDWTPGAGDAAQTHFVKVTFTDPDFTVPGPLDFICGFEIRVPGCGDDLIDAGEDCDGAAGGACPGACRAPGTANECTCPVCGDDALDAGEQCDGTDDSACPGDCLGSCICAFCGDSSVNAIGEECDGSADTACATPGACFPPGDPDQCTCATCGDDRVHPGIGEECDGTADAACPGLCRAPGDPDECTCPVCGDDVIDGGEECDGTSDAACPGACRPAGDPDQCVCALCGDDRIDAGEQCDGTGDGIFGPCPGECQPAGGLNECECPTCGDDDVNQPGEQCDGSDDSACPGACLGSCVCAVCGDGSVNAAGEQCDGTDDAACPGSCIATGDPNACQCPVCGDGDVNQVTESCDGADDSACPGLCRGDCSCATCGDGITDAPAEECDGADDAACPGLCLPSGDANQCQCPVCGDDDVNQVGEQCDGADDTACPGSCSLTCTCSVCGDGVAESPVEICDGTDDAACPGLCLPSGNANECLCPVCGDGEVNQVGEVCDGADAGACPSGFCASDCSCAVCGDDEANQPGTEECDGTDATACDSVCLPSCICAVCGDGDLNQTSEVCDPPSVEICNNLGDDDGDNLTDCFDPDCPTECRRPDGTTFPPADVTKCTKHRDCRKVDPDSSCFGIQTCGADCDLVFGCEPIGPDPSQIKFKENGLDMFKMHALFTAQTVVHAKAEAFSIMIMNDNGIVYSASLLPGDLVGLANSSKKRFRFADKGARRGDGIRDGISKVQLRFKQHGGVPVWSFKIRAYADLSAATLPLMMTQVTIGNDGTALQIEWTDTGKGWRIRPADLR